MNRLHVGIFAALIALALCRIVIGYSEISQTIDEAVHVAAGVEWLEQHTYRLHPENPPLARVAVGLLPYLNGAESVAAYHEANRVLGDGPGYSVRLQLARAGALPALVLLAWLLHRWSKFRVGPWAALGGVALLTTHPAILAHAGLATTDIAAAAATLFAVLAFAGWLKEPSARRALLLGCAVGVGALVKFTVPLFAVASAIGIVAARVWLGPDRRDVGTASIVGQLGIALGVAATLIWSGYGWSTGRVDLGESAIY